MDVIYYHGTLSCSMQLLYLFICFLPARLFIHIWSGLFNVIKMPCRDIRSALISFILSSFLYYWIIQMIYIIGSRFERHSNCGVTAKMIWNDCTGQDRHLVADMFGQYPFRLRCLENLSQQWMEHGCILTLRWCCINSENKIQFELISILHIADSKHE